MLAKWKHNIEEKKLNKKLLIFVVQIDVAIIWAVI